MSILAETAGDAGGRTIAILFAIVFFGGLYAFRQRNQARYGTLKEQAEARRSQLEGNRAPTQQPQLKQESRKPSEADLVSRIDCFGLAQGPLASQIRLGLGQVSAYGPAAPIGSGGGPQQYLLIGDFNIDLDASRIEYASVHEFPSQKREWVEEHWPDFGPYVEAFASIAFSVPPAYPDAARWFSGGTVLLGFRSGEDANAFADAFGFWAGGPPNWVPQRLQDDEPEKIRRQRSADLLRAQAERRQY